MSINEYSIPTISNPDTGEDEKLAGVIETGNYDFEAFRDEENYQNQNEVSEEQLKEAKERFAEEVQQFRGKGLRSFINRHLPKNEKQIA